MAEGVDTAGQTADIVRSIYINSFEYAVFDFKNLFFLIAGNTADIIRSIHVDCVHRGFIDLYCACGVSGNTACILLAFDFHITMNAEFYIPKTQICQMTNHAADFIIATDIQHHQKICPYESIQHAVCTLISYRSEYAAAAVFAAYVTADEVVIKMQRTIIAEICISKQIVIIGCITYHPAHAVGILCFQFQLNA